MRRPLLLAVVYLGILLLLSQSWGLATAAVDGSTYVRKVRVIRTGSVEVSDPTGLAFSPERDAFIIFSSGRPGRAVLMSRFGESLGAVAIDAGVPDTLTAAWDGMAGRLLLLGAGGTRLIGATLEPAGASAPLATIDLSRLASSLPQSAPGMTVDPKTGRVFLLDAAGRRIVRLDPDPLPDLDRDSALARAKASAAGLEGLTASDLRGIAFNPEDGHLYLLNPAGRTLYELTVEGRSIGTRDLSSLGLVDPQGMVFAPSGDRTDDPAHMSLYLADSRRGDRLRRPGQLLELSLVQAPVLQAAPTVVPNLVRTINTAAWSPPSPDPMDITYLPNSNRLLVSDSEVEEAPQVYWHGVNLFESTLTGVLVKTETTYVSSPTSLSPGRFSSEPTGVAYDSRSGHWFFSDDDADKVFEVDLVDGVYGNADDRVTSFSAIGCGDNDAESIAVDTGRNHLILADGLDSEVFDIAPGPNGRFDGCTSPGDDVSTHFDTASIGIADPEGVEYNPDNGHLYVTGHHAKTVIETTSAGSLIATYDLTSLNISNPSGLAYAPGSVNPAIKDLYISARGVDNDTDPNENDGKVYEIALAPTTCGNGVREGGEQCDGADLGGAACADKSCSGGTPTCTPACTLSYSTCTGCPVCGNAIRETGEQCDGADLGSAACTDKNCAGGTPGCTSACTLSYTTCIGCPVCGDGIKETGEVCDGADLAGQTCRSQGFGSGSLSCRTDCSGFDTSKCSVCNLDGACSPGESCTTCPNECIRSGPVCGNHVCETANGEDCRSCPADCNGIQNGKPERRYCCGDGDGTRPVGCGDARCTANGRTCSSVATPVFCCGDGSCQSGETSLTCPVDCGV